MRASRPSATAYETLKHSLQTDRLCLLNRHLSLQLQSPHSSPVASATAPTSPLPRGLKAREAEAWEEPGALAGMQDPRLEGALHLLLVQQHLRARARASTARLRVPSALEEMASSPPAGSDSESSESEAPKPALSTEDQPDRWHPQSTGQGSFQKKETLVATQDCPPDKPLDLSDRGRCRDISKSTGQPLPLSPTVVHTLGPQLPTLSRPLIHSSQTLSNGSTETRAQESEDYSTPKVRIQPYPQPLCSYTAGGYYTSLDCLLLSAPPVNTKEQPSCLVHTQMERTEHILQSED